jgi:NAD(P)-dependent dehydrogenase (short-subunit alcohol dehydrogenase family)
VLVTYHLDVAWGTIEECDLEAFARVAHHNGVGPVAATKAFLPPLKAAGGASIVHLGKSARSHRERGISRAPGREEGGRRRLGPHARC